MSYGVILSHLFKYRVPSLAMESLYMSPDAGNRVGVLLSPQAAQLSAQSEQRVRS